MVHRVNEAAFLVEIPRHNLLDQLVGITALLSGRSQHFRFLLGSEMYFHSLQDTGKPKVRQASQPAITAPSPPHLGRERSPMPLIDHGDPGRNPNPFPAAAGHSTNVRQGGASQLKARALATCQGTAYQAL